MINTATKMELAELREEAYQDALQRAFDAEYEKVFATYCDEGYSDEEADLRAQDEARERAKESYEDYLV